MAFKHHDLLCPFRWVQTGSRLRPAWDCQAKGLACSGQVCICRIPVSHHQSCGCPARSRQASHCRQLPVLSASLLHITSQLRLAGNLRSPKSCLHTPNVGLTCPALRGNGGTGAGSAGRSPPLSHACPHPGTMGMFQVPGLNVPVVGSERRYPAARLSPLPARAKRSREGRVCLNRDRFNYFHYS